jgi:hypothetical protein
MDNLALAAILTSVAAVSALGGLLGVIKKNKAKAALSAITGPPADGQALRLAVDRLVALYDESPRGEGFITGSGQAEPVRNVGSQLNDLGGFRLMREAHALFAEKRPRAARNLEMVWGGIGSWGG